MKKRYFKYLCVVFALCVAVGALSACGGIVARSIEITSLPTVMEYVLGEEFDASGGEITVLSRDGESTIVPFSDENVTLTPAKPNLKTAGKKYITVQYGGKKGPRDRFYVEVKPFTVKFELNFDDMSINSLYVKKYGGTIVLPKDPVIDGYLFNGWFTDSNFTNKFDVKDGIKSDMTLYANWLDVSKTYYSVNFDICYYGGRPVTTQRIEEGITASRPTVNPVRKGYSFDGWYTAETGGSEFDFAQAIYSDKTAYAHWTRTETVTKEYILEGEDIDFTGKRSQGYSGTATGTDMICVDITGTASNGLYIGWTYQIGLTLDFHFISDKSTTANILVRLSAEFADMYLTPDMFEISLNGAPVNYGSFNLNNVPTTQGQIANFRDFTLVNNAQLNKDHNILKITVTNGDNWLGPNQGTIAGTAPLIDCFKITTDAVIDWDATYDLPKRGNY